MPLPSPQEIVLLLRIATVAVIAATIPLSFGICRHFREAKYRNITSLLPALGVFGALMVLLRIVPIDIAGVSLTQVMEIGVVVIVLLFATRMYRLLRR